MTKGKDLSLEEQLEKAKSDLKLMSEACEALSKVIFYGWHWRLRETQEVIKAYQELWKDIKNRHNMQ